MTAKALATLSLVALLAGCAGDPALIEAPAPVASAETVRIAYDTVALRDVSLPRYATSDEIVVGGETGALESTEGVLWADDPVRAVTLGLTRALHEITGARVASEPWPFLEEAQVPVDVRTEEFLPSAAGIFEARGLYYVAPVERLGAAHAHSFDIALPFDPESGVAGMAAARSQVLAALARQIATTALR